MRAIGMNYFKIAIISSLSLISVLCKTTARNHFIYCLKPQIKE